MGHGVRPYILHMGHGVRPYILHMHEVGVAGIDALERASLLAGRSGGNLSGFLQNRYQPDILAPDYRDTNCPKEA